MWPCRVTTAVLSVACLLGWALTARAQVLTLTFDNVRVGRLQRRAFKDKNVVMVGGSGFTDVSGMQVVDCEAGWMNNGIQTKAAGCKRLLRIRANGVDTPASFSICGAMDGALGYYCARRDYSRHNPAYDTSSDGYVPFSNVYVKYRTYSDSGRLGVQLYSEWPIRQSACLGATMPRSHTGPEPSTTAASYTYSAADTGLWDLSATIAVCDGFGGRDRPFAFMFGRLAGDEVEEVLIESITIVLAGRMPPPRPPTPPPAPPLPPAPPRPPPSPPVPSGFLELTFDSLPVGLLRRDAFKDQKIVILDDSDTFPLLDRWSIVDCAAGWESGGVRFTAANCNKLLRIQANSLRGQPSISACHELLGNYYCADSDDQTIAEPQGARYIRNVIVRYRTFGRTYRFASQFYNPMDPEVLSATNFPVCADRQLPTFPPTHTPPNPDTAHFRYSSESNTVSVTDTLDRCRMIMGDGRPFKIIIGAADFPFENDEEILIESIQIDLRAPAPPPLPEAPSPPPSTPDNPPEPGSPPFPSAPTPPPPFTPGNPNMAHSPGVPRGPAAPALPPPLLPEASLSPPPYNPPVPWVWGSECTDMHPNCQLWASTNQCTLSPGYMLLNCKTACGVPLCVGTDDPTARCRDMHPNCGGWAVMGECLRTRGYMEAYCQLSCNTCPPAGTPGVPSMPSGPPAEAMPIANGPPTPSPDYDTPSPSYGTMPPLHYGPSSPPAYSPPPSPGHYGSSPAPSYVGPSPIPVYRSVDAPSDGGSSSNSNSSGAKD